MKKCKRIPNKRQLSYSSRSNLACKTVVALYIKIYAEPTQRNAETVLDLWTLAAKTTARRHTDATEFGTEDINGTVENCFDKEDDCTAMIFWFRLRLPPYCKEEWKGWPREASPWKEKRICKRG